MESTFDLLESSISEFWDSPSSKAKDDIKFNKVFNSCLCFLTAEAEATFITRKVVLTTTKLYCLDDDHEPFLVTKISWKLLKPFTELSGKNEERFGFTLKTNTNEQDFYTFSLEHLDLWIENLQKFCLSSEIEDNFLVQIPIKKARTSKILLARSLENDLYYVIKSINKNKFLDSGGTTRRLAKAIQIMRKIDHPYFSNLHKVYETEKYVHLVIDYASGGTFFRRIKSKRIFEEQKALVIVKKLLFSVRYLSSKGLVHRNIKPENILMVSKENDFEMKIIDFGTACKEHDETESGICGSPGYIAPEILRQEEFSSKADVFSVGVIMHILLLGKIPFKRSENGLITRSLKDLVAPPQKLSKQCVELLMMLLNPDPKKRPSASEALEHKWFYKQRSFSSKVP